jgi:hypothetical protein
MLGDVIVDSIHIRLPYGSYSPDEYSVAEWTEKLLLINGSGCPVGFPSSLAGSFGS